MAKKVRKISKKWIQENRFLLREFLDETEFPDPERTGERGPKFQYGSDVWWEYSDIIPPNWNLPTISRMGVHKLPNILASYNLAIDSIEIKDTLINEGIITLEAYIKGNPIHKLLDFRKGF